MEEMSYQKAGVDINLEEKTIDAILSEVGKGTGVIQAHGKKLVLCIDGVGSKILIANSLQKWDTIGIDCIAMNVNDALCLGAKPIAFVDYLAMETINPTIAREIARGLQKGADISEVKIIGGETATLPDIINGLDLAGTCLGVVLKDLPQEIKPGDHIIGLQSTGLHSNGYTLARKIIEKEGLNYTDPLPDDRTIGDILLEPTQIYVKEMIDLMKHIDIKAFSHITGGGLRNLIRLSKKVCFTIKTPLEPQKIFHILQRLGNVSLQDMYQTFNMGMGFAVIVSSENTDDALDRLDKYPDLKAKHVGHTTTGQGVEVPHLQLRY